METISTIDKSSESRKKWRQANPNKLAEYARNYYHKRTQLTQSIRRSYVKRKKKIRQSVIALILKDLLVALLNIKILNLIN